MVQNHQQLISDFIAAVLQTCPLSITSAMIQHHVIRAPHTPPSLPAGKCGVYVFSLGSGTTAKAGAHRALKVGRIGINSGPRFQYQHYNSGSANSTVAGALENNKLLWSYLGIPRGATDLGTWLKNNTDRDHFFLDGSNSAVVPLLEVYLKGVLGPVLEGSLKNHATVP